jgi:hypothetical protein
VRVEIDDDHAIVEPRLAQGRDGHGDVVHGAGAPGAVGAGVGEAPEEVHRGAALRAIQRSTGRWFRARRAGR